VGYDPVSLDQPTMTPAFLNELFVHMEWADAKVFQASHAAQSVEMGDLPSGTYVQVLEAGATRLTRTLVLIR
jgi:hypothetical protein